MKWANRKFIFNFNNFNSYFYKSAMIPIPVVKKDYVRFYIAGQSKSDVGYPTYIDCDINDFSNILRIGEKPLFDVGFPGTFDQDGCVPLSVVELPNNKAYMYYVGFELGTKARYRMLTGLAIAEDGENFKRYSDVPILERVDNEALFRCGPFVMLENGIFRMWYVAGNSWSVIEGKALPNYTINYLESSDGIHWDGKSKVCIDIENENEHGFGRPYIIKHNGLYKMFYCIRIKKLGYRLGYAESKDGINWHRKDNEINFDVANKGWDAEVLAYPAVTKINGNWYMFYNGNGMGKSGFGYAELVEW